MIPRILEPEVMDTAADAADYDAMDHAAVNAQFATDLLAVYPANLPVDYLLDIGTGTALIPIELCRRRPKFMFLALDPSAEMLKRAQANVEAAGFSKKITLVNRDGRTFSFRPDSFTAVISNSTFHHIPDPLDLFAKMIELAGRMIFVRDLLRPDSREELDCLVKLHAAGANDHQRQLFADSLHAALTLAEVQALVGEYGFGPETVRQTSDRHWTFHTTR